VRHQYQAVSTSWRRSSLRSWQVDASFDVASCCPSRLRVSGARQHDKAIAAFETRAAGAERSGHSGYLIEANMRRRSTAPQWTRRRRRSRRTPMTSASRGCRRRRLPQRQSGSGIALLEEAVRRQRDEPLAYVSLAQAYSEAGSRCAGGEGAAGRSGEVPDRRYDCVRARHVFDSQKKFADAESAFRQVLARDPRRHRRSTISATCSRSVASGSTNR